MTDVLDGKYVLYMRVGNEEVVAHVDTVSDISLIRRSLFDRLTMQELPGRKLCFWGIGSNLIQTKSRCNLEFEIDGYKYNTEAHIVEDRLIKTEILLGANFLKTIDLRVVGENIIVEPLTANQSIDKSIPDIFKIEVESENTDDTIDIECERSKLVNFKSNEVCKNYVSKGTRYVGVTIKIVLKEDKAIYQPAVKKQ